LKEVLMKVGFTYATQDDLASIVAIYNEAIPTRLSTADLKPVSVASKQAWFNSYNPKRRPLWVLYADGRIVGVFGKSYFSGVAV
jgi:phosphinothricin acetyltransferase